MALSKLQYARLADMAKKAWDKQPAEVVADVRARAESALNDFLLSPAKVFEFWRREWQLKTTGKESMADMTNRDFDKLEALWLELAGDINGALRKTYDDDNKLRQLRHTLRTACIKAGLDWPSYANGIAADKFGGRTVEQLGEQQLLHVLYTVRNRAKSKRDAAAKTAA